MRIKLETKTPVEHCILNYLENNASDTLIDRINKGTKTLTGALNYCKSCAGQMRKQNDDGCVCVDNETVFGWVIHFFEEDTIKEEKTYKRDPVTPRSAPKPKQSAPKQAEQDTPQMDMFSALFSGGSK